MTGQRTSKFNEVRTNLFLEAIKEGLTVEVASQRAQVAVPTIYNWLKKGNEAKRGAYRQFALDFEEARREAEQVLLDVIHEASLGKRYARRTVKQIYEVSEGGTKILVREEVTEQTTVDVDSAWRLLASRRPDEYSRRAIEGGPSGPGGNSKGGESEGDMDEFND